MLKLKSLTTLFSVVALSMISMPSQAQSLADMNQSLKLAATRGDLSTVNSLIALGADVNFNDGNATVLESAIYNAHADVVNALIQHKVSLDTVDRVNLTPLMEASMFTPLGQLDVVKALVENGGMSVNEVKVLSGKKITALDQAQSSVKFLQGLMSIGPNPSTQARIDIANSIVTYLVSKGAKLAGDLDALAQNPAITDNSGKSSTPVGSSSNSDATAPIAK